MMRDFLGPMAVLAAAAFMLNGTMLNHDTSWYLISTGWWLDGVPIYDDLLELNPPWAFYLTVPPVWIARLLDISATTVFQGYTLILSAISLLTAASILRSPPRGFTRVNRFFLVVASAALVLLPIKDFGEREHLFAIFYLPYFTMLLADRPLSRRQRGFVALWATLGIALKHYFVLLPLLVLTWQLIRDRGLHRLLRVEVILSAILLAGYVIGSWVLHPAYFDKVIPLTLAVYGTSGQPFALILKLAMPVLAILMASLALSALTRPRSASHAVALLTAIAAILVFFIQSKGWTYHRVPADIFTCLAVAWIGADLARIRQRWWPALTASMAVLVLLQPAIAHGPYKNGLYKEVATLFQCAPGDRSFQVYSSAVSTGFPLANHAEAQPSNRAPTLWLFPGAVYHLQNATTPQTRRKYQDILEFARSEVLSDFFRVQPQLVIVDEARNKLYFKGADFDYVAYFSENPAFRDAWRKYERVGKFAHFGVYRRPGC